MRPSEKYKKLMKVCRLCAAACGADVADPNYHVNLITGCVVFCITMYFIFSFYTVHLKFSENWGILLESFCMVGSVFQGISKLLCGIILSKKICFVNILLTEIYLEYEIKNDKYEKVLDKCVSNVTLLLKCITLNYIVIFTWFFVAPVIFYLFTGNRYMLMQFYLPGLDVDTNFGYFATLAMQASCLIFGGFGTFAGDLFVIIYNTHFLVFADILRLKFYELNEMAENKDLKKREIENHLNEIIAWHQNYSQLTETCNEIFYWITFTQITTSALSLVLTLFILLFGNWPGCYAYLALVLTMLYTYCGIGTLIEVVNDKFCDEIYACHWYNLPVSAQKCILLMLMKSQDPNLLTVGGVMPLSVNTGLQVTKSVYSIMMMLLNVVE